MSVFPEPDGIVSVDVDHVTIHDRRETNRWSHVIGEDQERRAVGNESAVHRHAIHHCAHSMLTDSKMEIPS